ncbi:rhodanese family protein [Sphingomonas sp. ASV193]|uniref:rhodanese family protein n=1 Tax=Sphingomonas sp. ASV193 TaxID=3144405 RepID=UPI0032E8552B
MTTTISPDEAHTRIRGGATLVDLRSADERARARIAGSVHAPLDSLGASAIPGETLVFHCRSGMRTRAAAATLAEVANGRDCYIIDGGIDGWAKAGLPVERDSRAPIEMQRQVMIVAGTLVLTGTLMSLFVARAWIGLAMFVGAGLTVAGATGFCGMAKILALMPWNRRVA